MTPTPLEQYLKADDIDDKSHPHEHSLYLRCNDCHLFGTPFPNDRICGNCGSEDTINYYPRCCVLHARSRLVRMLEVAIEYLEFDGALMTLQKLIALANSEEGK